MTAVGDIMTDIKTDVGEPKPTHYLARDGEKFTPLIPLDELPPQLKITGIPTYINNEELIRAHGTGCFPILAKSIVPYGIEFEGKAEGGKGSDRSGSGSLSPGHGHVNVPNTQTRDDRINEALREVKEHRARMKKSVGNQVYNPTTPGVLGTKVYCTHWMRTGECDFTQQGCMFLHVMPDLDTLELLGFRSYPRWFREMPREWQLENCKAFDEAGLDTHRHAQQLRGGPRGYGNRGDNGGSGSGGGYGHNGGYGNHHGGGGPGSGGYGGPPPGNNRGYYGGAPAGYYGSYGGQHRGWGYVPNGPYGGGGAPPPSFGSSPAGPRGTPSVYGSEMSTTSVPMSPHVIKPEPDPGFPAGNNGGGPAPHPAGPPQQQPPQAMGTGLSSPVPSVPEWKTMTPRGFQPYTPRAPSSGFGNGNGGSNGGGPPAPATPEIVHPKRFTDPKFHARNPPSQAPDAHLGGGRNGQSQQAADELEEGEILL